MTPYTERMFMEPNLQFIMIRALVKSILEHATDYTWSIQGLGMLRLYFSTELRLHVWDSKYQVKNVSKMHNHPWSFDSLVVAGQVSQQRYISNSLDGGALAYETSVLQCGPGGCIKTQPNTVYLARQPYEQYKIGDSYRQDHAEIHESSPLDGTVTLVRRVFDAGDVDHANVYWRKGTEWVSAEPRPATQGEIRIITGYALRQWF